MKDYNEFQDGLSRGIFAMCDDLREFIEYLENEEFVSNEEIIEELKKTINDIVSLRITARSIGMTQETYDIWVNSSKIIRTDVKYKLLGNLMEYGD